jgi:hypothetical protein
MDFMEAPLLVSSFELAAEGYPRAKGGMRFAFPPLFPGTLPVCYILTRPLPATSFCSMENIIPKKHLIWLLSPASPAMPAPEK